MYLGLRTRQGIVLPDPCPAALEQTVGRWAAAGWAVTEPAAPLAVPGHAPDGSRGAAARPPRVRARLTPQGWLRLDELVATI
jgi:hypothetical protein